MADSNTSINLTKQQASNVYQTNESSIEQQLTDANKEIEELKLALAWLERPYE